MKQEQTIKIKSEDNKIILYVDNGVAFGALHDFLMYVKGVAVEKMNKAHLEEKKATDAVKAKDVEKIKEQEEVAKETK